MEGPIIVESPFKISFPYPRNLESRNPTKSSRLRRYMGKLRKINNSEKDLRNP